MAVSELRRVLGQAVSLDDFRNAATSLGLARERHWDEREGSGYEEVWLNADRTRGINFFDDYTTGIKGVAIRARKPEELADELADKIRIYSPSELIETAWTSKKHNEQVLTLNRLFITFPDYDDEIAGIFERFATAAPSPILRRATLQVIARTMWEQLFPLVESVAKNDLDAEVRDDAVDVLKRWIALRNRDPRGTS